MNQTSTVAQRLTAVRERVESAAHAAGRSPDDVRVLLATKTLDADVVRTALELPEAAGMLRGENRVQELVAKGPALADLTVETHLIGPLQSNKVNAALRWAGCIESVASVDLGRRLSERVPAGSTLDVMVQVNVSGEPTKHGVVPEDALDLAVQIAGLPGLRLLGFMTVGANSPEADLVRTGYARLADIRDRTIAEGVATATELSMGMSGDLELAVAEGATLVRVGTAVFGPRQVR
ncbi:MAG: YggS family pyridoxal phosphate-dependent enzyme [Cellulomonas sp.]|nr:YggS family pyridoxal phosphate-dependent enzyme [Cellulomonas sp.]